VQLLLTYHGFDPGKIDGIVGGRTRTAIAAFTAKHKLPAMSADHPDLHAALREKLPRAPGDWNALAPPAPATRLAIPDLRLVQSLLAFLGHRPGPVDGKPGPRTRSAIRDFQGSRGVGPTGEVDAGLLAALEAETKRTFGHNRNADTRLVQQILDMRGFDTGAIDGLVGPKTRAAIAVFQQGQGTAPAGVIDAALLDALLAGD
jgi:peptidoglycan hydrolase-like protein with peptidoglycan-binding domain